MPKLKILLKQGENNAVEFKSSGVSVDGLAKEIVTFANTLGGSILVGVEDDGFISGVNNQMTIQNNKQLDLEETGEEFILTLSL